jgi:hypothetical protein
MPVTISEDITGVASVNSGAIGGRRNIVYNGEMKVAQRSASVAGLGAAAGYFTLDRWNIGLGAASAGRFTMAQIADGPAGFANCTKLSCTTADTSIAAGEQLIIHQALEGQDLQQIKKGTASAEQLTVSFWVKGNASATYVAELYDADNTRQISKTFAVTTSWARITLTYPADTTGAFDDDNAASLYLILWLHGGSTYTSGTLNSSAWAAVTSANRAVGISSFFDATSRTLFFTGVQMEIGATATDFEHRTFGEELALCQRYYEKSYDYIVALGTVTYNGMHVAGGDNIDPHTSFISGNFVEYTQRKRAAATVVFYDQAGTAGVAMRWQLGVSNTNGQNITMSGNSVRGIFTYSSGTASATGLEFHFTASAEL